MTELMIKYLLLIHFYIVILVEKVLRTRTRTSLTSRICVNTPVTACGLDCGLHLRNRWEVSGEKATGRLVLGGDGHDVPRLGQIEDDASRRRRTRPHQRHPPPRISTFSGRRPYHFCHSFPGMCCVVIPQLHADHLPGRPDGPARPG